MTKGNPIGMKIKFLFILLLIMTGSVTGCDCGGSTTQDTGDEEIVEETPVEETPVPEEAVTIDTDADGFSETDDCNDTNAAINPSALEICDGIDNDCDATTFCTLEAAVVLEQLDQSGWVKFVGEHSFDAAGSGLQTVGDINGDGTTEFLIGAHTNNEWGLDAGAAYLVTSSSLSGVATFDLSGAYEKFIGVNDGDQVGKSLHSVSDFNGDGAEDIIIGSLFSDALAIDAGGAYLVSGASITGGVFDLATADIFFQGEGAYSLTGFLIKEGGDLNNNGITDLVISAIDYSSDETNATGAVYVLDSNAVSTGSIHTQAWLTILGAGNGDEFGDRVSVGKDVNQDGITDLLVSASYNDQNGEDAGAVYLIYGNSSLSGTLDLATQPTDGITTILGKNSGDLTGWGGVSFAGDVNGDSFEDILIGAHHNSDNGTDAGVVYLIYGSNTLPSSINLASTELLIAQIKGNAGDELGNSVAPAGDLNGDGFDDILIWAWGFEARKGAAYIIYGKGE